MEWRMEAAVIFESLWRGHWASFLSTRRYAIRAATVSVPACAEDGNALFLLPGL